jgi:small subunit ribosomal protein S16
VVVQDREKPRDGRFLEIVGTYNPRDRNHENTCNLNKERIEYWLGKGAVPSETVAQLIKSL